MHLVPCPSCTRHVKTTEASCPFCASALPASLASAVVAGSTQRLSRAAAFAFTASIAVTGCASGTSPGALDAGPSDAHNQKDGTPVDDGGGQALYGSPAPLYGAVPVDAGPADGGGPAPLYGAAPTDSGNG